MKNLIFTVSTLILSFSVVGEPTKAFGRINCADCVGTSDCTPEANFAESNAGVPLKWKSMSKEDQQRFCKDCGWTHVKVWSGNYCLK